MKLQWFLGIAVVNTESGDGIMRNILKPVYDHGSKGLWSLCFGGHFHRITKDLFIFGLRKQQLSSLVRLRKTRKMVTASSLAY